MVPREPSEERIWPCSARSLLATKVRIGNLSVGRIADILLNRRIGHVLGLVVEGRSGQLLFLPWVAARLEDGDVEPISVFALLSASELSFYLENGVRLTLALDGTEAAGGPLDDVLIDRDGDVTAVVPRLSPSATGAAG